MLDKLVLNVLLFCNTTFHSFLNLIGFGNTMLITKFRFFVESQPYTLTKCGRYHSVLEHDAIMRSSDSAPYTKLCVTYYYNGEKYQIFYEKTLIWGTISSNNLVNSAKFDVLIPEIVQAKLYNKDKKIEEDVTELIKQYRGPFGDYYHSSKIIIPPTLLRILRANQYNTEIWRVLEIEDAKLEVHTIELGTDKGTQDLYSILTSKKED